MKKEAYETAELEILFFQTADIITTSVEGESDPYEGPGVVG